MSLFVLGALLIQIVQPWLGRVRGTPQIGLAWLLNALYFAAFTAWALARNEAGGAAFWEHVAVDFCLSQFIILPVSLWFSISKNSSSRARLDSGAAPRRGRFLNPQMAFYQRLNPRLFVLSGCWRCSLSCSWVGWHGNNSGKNSDYERLERRQTLRRILQPGPRGQILDRNRMPLVINHRIFRSPLP